MNFAEATEAPIVEKVGAQDVTFPLLWIEDYLPWVAAIAADRKARSRKLIPAKSDALERFRMERMIELEDVGIEAIADKVWTPAGAMKILDLSLSKSGIKDEAERKRIVNAIPPRRICALAKDVSGLYEKLPPPKPGDQAEGDDPNARSAASAESSASSDPAATGSPT